MIATNKRWLGGTTLHTVGSFAIVTSNETRRGLYYIINIDKNDEILCLITEANIDKWLRQLESMDDDR